MTQQDAVLYWFIGAFPFYYTTWEETYTGAMNFPIFSAASDGTILVGLVSLSVYLVTPEGYIHNALFGIEYRSILFYVSMITALTISLSK